MKKIKYYLLLPLCCLNLLKAQQINILSLGAKGDGIFKNTAIIQEAINQCNKNGGGTVLIPTGNFVTGTLYLKSNVNLFVDKGAILTGSMDSIDYPLNSPKTVRSVSTHSNNGKAKKNFSLIYAEAQENISIEGLGIINGNGDNNFWQRGDNGRDRPKLIFLFLVKISQYKI